MAKSIIFQQARYAWEFLRRNESYIKDCEAWSGKSRKEWKQNEIILNYPLDAKIDPSSKSFNTACQAYYKQHSTEWGNLVSRKDIHDYFRLRGFSPPQTPRQFTWQKYWKKWRVLFPINPLIDFVHHLPIFMELIPINIITEPPNFYHVHTNDINLSKSTVSLLEINWASPIGDLRREFEQILADKKKIVDKNWVIQNKTRRSFDAYGDFLKIWDIKRDNLKIRWKDVARQVYPFKTKDNPEAAEGLTKANYEACKQLILGGYLKL